MTTATKTFVRLIVLLLVVGFAVPLFGVNAIEPPPARAGYPEFVTTGAWYLATFGLLLVLGTLIVWAVYHALRGDYNPATVVFVSIFILSLCGMLFFENYSFFGYFALDRDSARVDAFVDNYTWVVYGEQPVSEAHYASQAVSYEVQRGWVMSGASFFYRLIDFGFSSLLIPTVLFGGTLYAVHLTRFQRHWQPLVVHLLALVIGGWLLLWPSVKLDNSSDPTNPISRIMMRGFNVGDGLVDAPRITPVQALAFQLTTELTQRLGEALSAGSKDSNTVIFNASLDARMTDGDFEAYMRYAATCMTSVKSAMDKRATIRENPNLKDFYTRLAGSAGDIEIGGSVEDYLKAPVFAQHALSPYADAMFSDIWMQQWCYNDRINSRETDWFDNISGVTKLPEANTFHPNPNIGAGYIEKVYWDGYRIQHATTSDETLRCYIPLNSGVRPLAESYSRVLDATYGYGYDKYFLPFCSIAGFGGWGDDYADLASGVDMPLVLQEAIPSARDLQTFRPVGMDDIIRHRIGRTYLGDKSQSFCENNVSPERLNEHLWGCLLAGKYTDATKVQNQALVEIQDTFNRVWRPVLDKAYEDSYSAVQVNARERHPTPALYWQGGADVTSKWDFMAYREFMDMWMMAPGVQAQIGMTGNFKDAPEAQGNTDNPIYKFATMVFGPFVPTVAGIFAAIVTFIAKLVLMIYPHVIGVMSFYLLMAYLPYAVMSLLPGKYFMWMEWVKAVVVVCLMPLFCQFGLALMEQGNAIAMQTMFVRQQGGGDVGESILTLLGATFIFSSYSFAVATVTLGFGSLSGSLQALNSSAFRFTGAAVGGLMAVVGIAASALGGAALGAAGMSLLGKGKGATGGDVGGDSGPSPSGGGGSPKLPGGGGGTGGTKILSDGRNKNLTSGNSGNAQADAVSAQMRRSVGQGIGTAVHAVGSAGMMAAGAIGGDDLASGYGAGVSTVGSGVHGASMVGHGVIAAGSAARGGLRNMGEKVETVLGKMPFRRTDQGQADTEASKAMRFASDPVRAGTAWSQAASLSTNPIDAGRYALLSSASFAEAGIRGDTSMLDKAEEQHRFAETQIQRGIERAANPVERGEMLAMQTSSAVVGMQLKAARGQVDEVQPAYQQVLTRAGSAEQALGSHVENIQQSSFMGDRASDWSEYGVSQIARLKVAESLDRSSVIAMQNNIPGGQTKAVETFISSGLSDLSSAADKGNPQAAAVHGAILAGAGRGIEAMDRFTQAGITMNSDDVAKLRRDIETGKTSTIESLLRKMG